jgi:FtsH-binding integral membrane protein
MARKTHLRPYFPEPITVADNVSEQRHAVWVSFVRRVSIGHAVTVAAIGIVALWGGTAPFHPAWLALAGLALLSLLRRLGPRGPLSGWLDVLALAPTALGLGWWASAAHEAGWPVWPLFLATGTAGLYAALCGNDFSFVGQFVLSSLASLVAVAAAGAAGLLTPFQAWIAAPAVLGWLFFLAYDLSMLIKRRRPNEEPSAVVDLYRDLLNWTTYPVRVVLHWRRFKFI